MDSRPSPATVEMWAVWLRSTAAVLTGTAASDAAALAWAQLVGPIPPAARQALLAQCLADEQCTKLNRVLPGDVLRLLRNEADKALPGPDEAIREIWAQVSAAGAYAAVPGFDLHVARFSHPIVAAMASTAGWPELCATKDRFVADGQLRRYHEHLAARWREGRMPPPPTGIRCVIADTGTPFTLPGGTVADMLPARPVVEAVESGRVVVDMAAKLKEWDR